MKTFLTFFVLFFSSLVFADDISDFQIERMSIGDSLLDYFSVSEIKKKTITSYYKNKKDKSFIAIEFYNPKKFLEYDAVQVHIPNFNKYTQMKYRDYEIVHIVGQKIMEYNECKKKADEIDNILSNTFKGFDKRYEEKPSLDLDPTGDSIVYAIWFTFQSGDKGFINCYDWSEEKGYVDHLRVGLMTKDFNDWL